MSLKYRVSGTQPTTYITERGTAVNGYLLYITLPDLNETLEARVTTLDPATVKPIVEKLVNDREGLINLGSK